MNSKFRDLNSNQSGQSLVDMMVAVAIGTIVSLAMATLFTFGIQQFGLLVDENKAQLSLLESSYLIKSYLNQAVKITCVNAAIATSSGLGAADPNVPAGIPIGEIDCRPVAVPPADISTIVHPWTAGQKNLLALFFRETGGAGAGAATGTTYSVVQTGGGNAQGSTYVAAAIYFTPPANDQSGQLSFVQQGAGVGTISSGTGAIEWDHIVDVGVISGSSVNIGNPGGTVVPFDLESLNIRLVARYNTIFQSNMANISYLPGAANLGYNNIEMTIPISFRDNFLGISTNGTGTPERLYGGIYFFRFTGPPLTSFDL